MLVLLLFCVSKMCKNLQCLHRVHREQGSVARWYCVCPCVTYLLQVYGTKVVFAGWCSHPVQKTKGASLITDKLIDTDTEMTRILFINIIKDDD